MLGKTHQSDKHESIVEIDDVLVLFSSFELLKRLIEGKITYCVQHEEFTVRSQSKKISRKAEGRGLQIGEEVYFPLFLHNGDQTIQDRHKTAFILSQSGWR